MALKHKFITHFDQMVELFRIIYTSAETNWGDFPDHKFITENQQIMNFLADECQLPLSKDQIIKFVKHEWPEKEPWNKICQLQTEKKEQIEALQQKIYSLQQHINSYEPNNLFVLGIDELDKIKSNLVSQIAKVENAKQIIYDQQILCIICMDVQKNIIIKDCGHFVICESCENKLSAKNCPQCQTPYTTTFKINHK